MEKRFPVESLDARLEIVTRGMLKVGDEDISFTSQSQSVKMKWPVHGIRQFGYHEIDSSLFVFEAGRRCPDGPGQYVFRSMAPHAIYAEVDRAVERALSKLRGTPLPDECLQRKYEQPVAGEKLQGVKYVDVVFPSSTGESTNGIRSIIDSTNISGENSQLQQDASQLPSSGSNNIKYTQLYFPGSDGHRSPSPDEFVDYEVGHVYSDPAAGSSQKMPLPKNDALPRRRQAPRLPEMPRRRSVPSPEDVSDEEVSQLYDRILRNTLPIADVADDTYDCLYSAQRTSPSTTSSSSGLRRPTDLEDSDTANDTYDTLCRPASPQSLSRPASPQSLSRPASPQSFSRPASPKSFSRPLSHNPCPQPVPSQSAHRANRSGRTTPVSAGSSSLDVKPERPDRVPKSSTAMPQRPSRPARPSRPKTRHNPELEREPSPSSNCNYAQVDFSKKKPVRANTSPTEDEDDCKVPPSLPPKQSDCFESAPPLPARSRSPSPSRFGLNAPEDSTNYSENPLSQPPRLSRPARPARSASPSNPKPHPVHRHVDVNAQQPPKIPSRPESPSIAVTDRIQWQTARTRSPSPCARPNAPTRSPSPCNRRSAPPIPPRAPTDFSRTLS